jgi:hypothetical protein
MALASLSNGAVDSSYEQLRDALYPQGMDKEQFNKACADLNALLTYRKEKEREHERRSEGRPCDRACFPDRN